MQEVQLQKEQVYYIRRYTPLCFNSIIREPIVPLKRYRIFRCVAHKSSQWRGTR